MSLKLIRKPKSQWTGQTVREKHTIQVIVFMLNDSCIKILHLFCMEYAFSILLFQVNTFPQLHLTAQTRHHKKESFFPYPYGRGIFICAQHSIFQAYAFQGYSKTAVGRGSAASRVSSSVSFLDVPYTRFKLYMLSISNICRPFDLQPLLFSKAL